MNDATEQKRQRLIRKRLTTVTIVFALIGAGIAFYFLQIKEPAKKKKDPAVVVSDPARPDLNIGVLAPLQGELKPYGESIVRGARAAASLINSGDGVLGHNIKLHIADTRSDANLTAELTEDLIRRLKVSLIIGTASEEEALAGAEIATAGRTPFIYLGNGRVKTCSQSDMRVVSEYVWGAGLTEHMTVEPFLIYLADKLRQPETKFKVYYFGTDDETSRADALFALSSAESLGFETLQEQYVDPRIRDYFQKIRKIFRLSPDLLFVTTAKRNSALFLQQAAKLGVKTEMAIAGIHSFEDELLYPLSDKLDEVSTVLRYSEKIDSDANRTFLEAWRAQYPKRTERPTDIAVGGAYTAILAAAKAFEKAKALDAAAFREGMKNVEVAAPQGRVVVSAINNLFIQPLYAMKLIDGNYEVEEYLGDVSHPSLEACIVVGDEAEDDSGIE